jgi:hypothetical protein
MLPFSGAVPHACATQAPALQICPAPHATPQLPQLFGSVLGFDSQPLSSLPSQFMNGEMHGPMKQPTEHPLVAFG